MVHDPPALVASDCHLLQLGNIDKQQGQQLHHWLRAVRAAARKESLRWKKDERAKIMEYMTAVRQRQRVSTPQALRQQLMEAFVVGPHTNISFTARQDRTIPVHLGSNPTTTKLLAQSKLLEVVQDLDNN